MAEFGEGRFGRRTFLAASGTGLGAMAGFAPRVRPAAALATELGYRSWSTVRAAFPLTRHALHFTSFSYVRLGPSIVNAPDEVETALRAIRGLR